MTTCVLAIDQGTTNTKALLIDASGKIVANASRPMLVTHPKAGWAEQSADAIWRSVRDVIGECVAIRPEAKLVAVGISNQRESVLLWDRESWEPLTPCVIWQCRRTADRLVPLRRPEIESLVTERSGLAVDSLFPAAKIAWLIENTSGLPNRIASGAVCAGTVDSWLLFKLTGGKVHATDFSNASRTQLFNINQRTWDERLSETFGAPLALMPQAVPSDSFFGVTAGDGIIPADIPIRAVMGDSHAALYGHGVRAPGAVKATYGTGSSLMTLVDRPVLSRHGLSATIAWGAEGKVVYALEGNISVSGHAASFARKLLGLKDESTLTELARGVKDSDGVTFVPALAGLGAPHWRDEARGVITGMSLSTRPEHIARATIEAIALQIFDVFSAMEADLGKRLDGLSADGAAARNDFLIQVQADVLQRPVRRSRVAELSAIGVGAMAGIGAGLWTRDEAVARLDAEADVFAPAGDDECRRRLIADWRAAVDRAISATHVPARSQGESEENKSFPSP
jgi:glycerol kinase